ncbi:MAG: translation initiation factor IF-5A [Candidatus Altiarchaeota archaeon]|nr:translation initiation factor IF-5A [Candidatus Altiarchaeota archaeon]
MEKKIGTIKDLKEGKYVIIDNEPCRVVGVTHSKPGKHGGAKARLDAIGIFDGQKRNLMGPVDSNVEIPIINKKNAQVLNVIGGTAQLMDMTTYETFELPVPDELKGQLAEGIEVLYMESMGKRLILRTQ